MPNNRRPSGWLYNGDPDYKGTTVAERRHMQNTWDLLAEQEKANQIELEKIEQDRINNNNLIDTIERSNKLNKLMNEANNKALLETERLKTERLQLEHYYKICDDIGIDYEDIKLFLNNLEKSNSVIDLKLNELYVQLDILKNKKYNKKHDKYNEYVNSYNRILIKLQNTKQELDTLSIFTKLFNKSKLFKLEQKKNGLQNKLNELKDIIENYQPEEDNTSIEIEKINKQINELLNSNKQYILDKYNNFINFRKNHYNKDMEILFKKLNITPLNKEDINKIGTKEDYINYIKNNIL